MIKLKSYTINNLPLTNELLISFIKNFWDEIFIKIKNTHHLLILCKVYFTENDKGGGYRTLGYLRKVNYNDKELFIEYLTQCLSTIYDTYITQSISKITFSYIIKEGLCDESNRAFLLDPSGKVNTTHNFNNMNLPISMDPSDYGDVRQSSIIEKEGVSYERFTVINGTRIYEIDRSLDGNQNKVTILGAINLSWTDTKIDTDIFMREIKKSTIYFMGGEIVLRKQQLPAKPFKKLHENDKVITNFYTIDIETVSLDRKQTPYLICGYDGNDYITSFAVQIKGVIDQKTLFKSFFDNLLSTIDSGITLIYAHNLSGFDGVFLLKQLLTYGKVEPLLFNGKLMSIKVTISGTDKTENKVLIFKDSFLLLPLSLRKLCIAFKVAAPPHLKATFPFY